MTGQTPYERIETALKHLGLSGPLELAEDGLSALDEIRDRLESLQGLVEEVFNPDYDDAD